MASATIYVSVGGRQFGPYEREAVMVWLRAGQVAADAQVYDGGQWMPAERFLAGGLPPPLPGAAPTGDVILHPVDIANDAGPAARAVPAGRVAPLAAQDPAALPGPGWPRESDAPMREPGAPGPNTDALANLFFNTAPTRDRIVVLGRRQSGKTIYLASIYGRLWRSLDGMTAKALTGEAHKHLISIEQMLKAGEWPPATLGSTQIELELEYHGQKRLMITLDFAGELFRRAFVDDRGDIPGARELVKHIDQAAAVLMLVDPSVIAGMDRDAAVDDDFGLVQAVQRIRNWPGGEDVPIVMVLTKMDLHQELMDKAGGSSGFVRQYFPALLRTLQKIPIYPVSAVQSKSGPDGKPRPHGDSTPINIDLPLRYCLQQIENMEHTEVQRDAAEQRRMAAARLERLEADNEQRLKRRVILIIAGLLALGAAIVVLVLFRHF